MVCAEYFPRKIVYIKDEELVKDLRTRIDRLYMEIVNRTGKQQNVKSSSTLNNIYSNSNFPNDFNDDNKSEDSILQDETSSKQEEKENNTLAQINDLEIENDNDNDNEKSEFSRNKEDTQQEAINNETCFGQKQNKLNLDIKVDGESVNIEKSYDGQSNNQQEETSIEPEKLNKEGEEQQKMEEEQNKANEEEEEEQLLYCNKTSEHFKNAQNKYLNKLACLISDKESSNQPKEGSKDSNTKLGDDLESSYMTYSEMNGTQIKSNEETTQQKNVAKEAILEQKQQAFEEAVSEKIQEQLDNLSNYINGKQRDNPDDNQIKDQNNKEYLQVDNQKQSPQKNENEGQMEIEQENDLNEQKNSLKNQLNQLDSHINKIIDENQINELNSIKVNYINKNTYTFEDEVYIIQNRLFLLETLDYFEIMKGSPSDQRLASLGNVDLEKIINLLIIQYQQQQSHNSEELESLKARIKTESDQERRVNEAKDLDFTDILIDLNTMNPIEHEYIRFLESKQQLDYNQSIQLMQQQQNQFGDTSQKGTKTQQSSKSQGSTKQVMVKHSDETRCQVCNECDYADNDLIVFCSRCNMSVHQKCYGIASLPQEDWICDGCIAFGPNAKHLRCALCTKRGGALKRSKMQIKTNFFEHLNTDYHNYLKNLPDDIADQPEIYDTTNWDKERKRSTSKGAVTQGVGAEENSEEAELYFDFQYQNKVYPIEEVNKNEPKSKNIWIHLTCALWIQECYFEERSTLNMIKGIENIDKKRFHLTCMICKQKKNGCCIQCAKGKCSASFHPECARRAGLSLEVRHLEKVTHLVFCQRHTPLKLRRILEQKDKKYKDEIQKFCRSIEKYNETYFNDFKVKEKQKVFKPSKMFLKKAQKDLEREEKEFMKQLSQIMLETPQTNFVITLGKEYDDFEESILAYHVLDISRPKQSHLKTQMSKHDDIWKSMEFNDYTPINLFKMYKRLLKVKKTEFKNIFNTLKRIRDKEQEEFLNKQQKQMKKEQQLKKKEMMRQEKEKRKNLQKLKQLELQNSRKMQHTENDNLDSSQINQINEQYENDLSFLDDETSKQQISQSQLQQLQKVKFKRKYTKKKDSINTLTNNEIDQSSMQIEHQNHSQNHNGESKHHLQSHLNVETSNNEFELLQSNNNGGNDSLNTSSDFPLKTSKEKKLKKLKEKEQEKFRKSQQKLESQNKLSEVEKFIQRKKNLKNNKLNGEEENLKSYSDDNVRRKLSSISKGDAENDEEKEKLYCYCQKPYVEGEFMISRQQFEKNISILKKIDQFQRATTLSSYSSCCCYSCKRSFDHHEQNQFRKLLKECANCEEWFHFECIGYIGTDSQAENFDFCCNECDQDGNLFQKREIYEHLFDPQQALYSTYKQLKNKISTPSFRQKLLLERRDLASATALNSSTNLKNEKKREKKQSQNNLEGDTGRSYKSKTQTQSKSTSANDDKNKSLPTQDEENDEQALLSQLLQINESQIKKQQEKSKKTKYKIEDEGGDLKITSNIHPVVEYELEDEGFSDIMGSSGDEQDKEQLDDLIEEDSCENLLYEIALAYLEEKSISWDDVGTLIKLKLEDGKVIIIESDQIS